MDQQRRMAIFLVLSFAFTFLWLRIGLPYFYPEMLEKKGAQKQAAKFQDAEGNQIPKAVPELNANHAQPENRAAADDPKKNIEPATADLPSYPERIITLGSLTPDAKNFLQVDITSRGAAVTGLRLNDPRYRNLENRQQPLELLGSVPGRGQLSFDTRVAVIDAQLQQYETRLSLVDWEVDEQSLTDSAVRFRYPAPDGSCEVYKIFRLVDGNPTARDTDANGYCLTVELGFRNLTDKAVTLQYELTGPIGFPIEELQTTRRFLALQVGLAREGSVRHEQILASEIAEQAEQGSIEPLRSAVQYVGIDGQYFATLLIPAENQLENNWLDEIQPLLMKPGESAESSLISVGLVSQPLTLAAAEEQSFQYTLYAGPKRTALLSPFDAGGIIEYGWFGSISRIMLAIMNFFHHTLYLPYGLAIVMLTVIVRGLMYPISRKHAVAAKKMKEMQPRFEEIRKKYENDKEKLAKAQMDLMKESGFFSGCLPMLLQLPIFIGLYQALYVSVDLRMAEFFWIDNLAAPDRLFLMPFSIPFLGNDFNLLPMITVALFVVQQKLFAPPPANEEQALQQKMMSYMMIFIGVMFYKVPAGLCVYFIASSLWAIAERKILDFHDTAVESIKQKNSATENSAATTTATAVDNQRGWLKNVMSQLDAAANPNQKGKTTPSGKPKKPGKK